MRVVGLDLSLRATGYAGPRGVETLSVRGIVGMLRLRELRWKVVDMGACLDRADVVVIEDYAFSRADAHAHQLGELGGVIRLALWEAGVTYVNVVPSSLKKFATGKGNANKEQVLVAAIRSGAPEEVRSNNEADAWWLQQMGRYAYGDAAVEHTKYREDAIGKVDWPEIRSLTESTEGGGQGR